MYSVNMSDDYWIESEPAFRKVLLGLLERIAEALEALTPTERADS